jgi:vacuolar protein-sorting-associated protein 4
VERDKQLEAAREKALKDAEAAVAAQQAALLRAVGASPSTAAAAVAAATTANGKVDPAMTEEKAKLVGAMSSTMLTDKPNVPWDSIAGLDNCKQVLKEAAVLPFRFPSHFKGNRIAWNAVLLYGPPGTGKTMLAKAVATAVKGAFFTITAGDIMTKYIGESEQKLRTLFEMARKHKPSVIFIDEIDSMCGSRSDGDSDVSRRIKTELLTEMQSVRGSLEGVLVIGATNTPWDIDQAVRRRFNKRVYIPLPDQAARKAMLAKQLEDEPAEEMAAQTEGYSCSDLENMFKDANYAPIRVATAAKFFRKVYDQQEKRIKWTPCEEDHPQAENKNLLEDLEDKDLYLPPLTLDDYVEALRKTRPSVRQEDLARYEEWTQKYGVEG